MKLRIKGNSMRLRVGPVELSRLLETGSIEETVHFGPQPEAKLTYILKHEHGAAALTVHYEPGAVTVVLPTARTRQWADTAEIGVEGSVEVANGKLTVLVEKDFACLDPGMPHENDTFPNPLGKSCG